MKPAEHSLFLNQRGIVLLPIILVMVISLSMGVAIAYRVASTTHQAVVLTEADQAYHCAEAGIEESLEKIKGGDSSGGSGTLEDSSGDPVCDFSYTVADLGSGAGVLTFLLEKDAVYQVNLASYSGSLDIYWGLNNDQVSLVTSVVKGSAAPYSLEKSAYNCANHALVSGNGFSMYSEGDAEYPCKMTLGPFAGDASLLRIRALYNDTGVQVLALGASFPVQGHEITSTGQAGDSQRIVVVTRGQPALPAIFDYVLFSGSASKALEK